MRGLKTLTNKERRLKTVKRSAAERGWTRSIYQFATNDKNWGSKMENTHPSHLGKSEVTPYNRDLVVNNNHQLNEKYNNDRQFQKYRPDDYLAIVDKRALERECLAQALLNHHIGLKVFTFGSLEEWQASKKELSNLRAVLINTGNRSLDDAELTAEISELVATFETAAVVVVADNDDLTFVLKALELGVRGYIPTTVGIEICMQAIELAIAGGKFVPASSVLALRKLLGGRSDEFRHIATSFTARQSAVAEGLRRGKANKIIAYELNLCESTVKVHIRNIMKKLGATNRTEVAYKISDMIPHESRF